MNEIWTVAVDLDGVLAGFEQKVEEINGMPFSQIPRGRLWKSIERYDKEEMPFFGSLNKMADADMLFNFVKKNFANFFILTATGHVPRNAAEQKRTWVAKHYGRDVVVKTVTSSSQKAAYANARTILIDDREKSTLPWEAAGGIAILHRNAADTIEQLKKIVAGGK